MNTKDLINSRKLYILLSGTRMIPYLDAEKKSFLFLSEEDGKRYIEKHGRGMDIALSGEQEFDYDDLCALLYSRGTKKIVFFEAEEKIISLSGRHLARRSYYNAELNGAITCLRESRKKDYLLDMAGYTFIVPVFLSGKGRASVTYGTAQKEGRFYSLAFADKPEFDAWLSKGDLHGWQPLRISALALTELAGGREVIVNPCGNHVLLTGEMVRILHEEAKRLEEKGDG